MTVYLIEHHYDNGESYEDHRTSNSIYAVAPTEEKAKEWIANYNPNDEDDDEESRWIEGETFNVGIIERQFYKQHDYDDDCQWKWFTIKPMKVLE